MKDLGIDLFCSGIKDKYVFQKMHIPSRQMHSYDYSGPYTGFEGFVQFAKDIENEGVSKLNALENKGAVK